MPITLESAQLVPGDCPIGRQAHNNEPNGLIDWSIWRMKILLHPRRPVIFLSYSAFTTW
jgi:hypothetical protein